MTCDPAPTPDEYGCGVEETVPGTNVDEPTDEA